MTEQRHDAKPPASVPGSWTRLLLIGVTVLAIGACGGTAGSPASTVSASDATTGPTAGASGAAACIDAEAAAIIEALRAPGADVQAIITEQGATLVAGLQRFSPPPDAMAWRDELVAGIESGDVPAVLSKVEEIGDEVVLAFC